MASIDPSLIIDFLAALRLCTNLESFTWTSPGGTDHATRLSRSDKVFIDYLHVLKRIRVPKLVVNINHGLDTRVLTELMYMPDLRSISVNAPAASFVRLETMAAALRERLTHLSCGVETPEDYSKPSRKSITCPT